MTTLTETIRELRELRNSLEARVKVVSMRMEGSK